MTTPANIFSAYLDAFTAGDLESAFALVADDFVFHGPMLQSKGKAAFVEGASGLGEIVKGHDILRQWSDGDEACTIYDFHIETPVGKASVTMTEWVLVRNGKLARSRLVFNSPEFTAVMPS
ncbi:MAG: nuclear transport factor 2 family protein [Nannocystales bacterium]